MSIKKSIYIVLVSIFFFQIYSICQKYPVKTVSIEDGLPHTQVYGLIYDDIYNSLWVRMPRGIAIYDGKKFNLLDDKIDKSLEGFMFPNDSTNYVYSRSLNDYNIYTYSFYGDSLSHCCTIDVGSRLMKTIPNSNKISFLKNDYLYRIDHNGYDSLKVNNLAEMGNYLYLMVREDRIIATSDKGEIFLLDGNDMKKIDIPYENEELISFSYSGDNDLLIMRSDKRNFYYFRDFNKNYENIVKEKKLNLVKVQDVAYDRMGMFIDTLNYKTGLPFSAGINQDNGELILTYFNLEDSLKIDVENIIIPDLKPNQTFDLFSIFSSRKKIVLSTVTHLYIYDLNTEKFTILNSKNLFNMADINDIVFDAEERMWFATNGSGLKVLLTTGIKNYYEDFPNLSVQKAVEDDEGYLWGATDYGVVKVDKINGVEKTFTEKQGLESVAAWAMEYYNNSIVAGAKYHKLYRIKNDKVSEIKFPVPDSVKKIESARSIIGSYVDSENRLYFTYKGNTFVRYSPNTRKYELFEVKHDQELDPSIYAFYEVNDKIYISANGSGLVICDKEDPTEQKLITEKDGLLNNNIYCFAKYNGKVWMGSYYNGYYIFDPEKEEILEHSYPVVGGKKIQAIKAITADKFGNLWMGTNDGILKYDGSRFYLFTQESGLSTNETRTTGISQTKEGELIFGSAKGIMLIDPEKLKPKTKGPKLFFKKITANNNLIDVKTEAELDYFENNLFIDFTAADHFSPFEMKYFVRLTNFNDDWKQREVEFAEYSNLKPGTYTFMAYAEDKLGNKSSTIKYSFIIKPPFWGTWWFRIIGIIIVLGFAEVVLKYRTAALKKKNLVLENKVKERTLELEMKNDELKITLEELREAHKELKEANKLLHLMSVQDDLTKIYNRRYFMKELEEYVKESEKTKESFGLMLLDIDKFKNFNDTYGHLIGDKVLRQVASKANLTLRGIDIFARYGGEEFVALLPNTNHEQAIIAAERIRKEVEKMIVPTKQYHDLKVTVSIGVTYYDPAVHDIEVSQVTQIINQADEALYYAKDSNRNNVKSYFRDIKKS